MAGCTFRLAFSSLHTQLDLNLDSYSDGFTHLVRVAEQEKIREQGV